MLSPFCRVSCTAWTNCETCYVELPLPTSCRCCLSERSGSASPVLHSAESLPLRTLPAPTEKRRRKTQRGLRLDWRPHLTPIGHSSTSHIRGLTIPDIGARQPTDHWKWGQGETQGQLSPAHRPAPSSRSSPPGMPGGPARQPLTTSRLRPGCAVPQFGHGVANAARMYDRPTFGARSFHRHPSDENRTKRSPSRPNRHAPSSPNPHPSWNQANSSKGLGCTNKTPG